MEEQMNIFKQINSGGENSGKGNFSIEDLSIDRLVAILAVVVKSLRIPNNLKPFEVWAQIQQHLGATFFTQVISHFYGLEPEPAEGLMNKFRSEFETLKEWSSTQILNH